MTKHRDPIIEQLESRQGTGPRKITAWYIKLIPLLLIGGGIAWAFIRYNGGTP